MLAKQSKINKKKQKSGFLVMLLGTLGTSSLGNMLAGRGVIRTREKTNREFIILYELQILYATN